MIDAKKLQSSISKNTKAAMSQLNSIRNNLNEIENEIHWLDNSPLPIADAIENISRYVKENSKPAGINHFFYSTERTGKKTLESEFKFKHGEVITHEYGGVIGGGTVDIAEIICSLFGIEVEKSLQKIAMIAAKDIESGPPLSERPQLKRQLAEEKMKLEIKEELLISSAEELGFIGFYRRHDCNPEIVLMMEDD